MSLSSVKRYVQKAHRGESLAPKRRPGSAPKLDQKAMRLLEKDLTERPFASLQERCEYIGAITGISVSRSTMCRAISWTTSEHTDRRGSGQLIEERGCELLYLPSYSPDYNPIRRLPNQGERE